MMAALAGTCLGGMTVPVWADDADDENGTNVLEEVIVTATKRATKLMDTPIAISAFTDENLNKLGIKNVKDLNNLVPNMSIMIDVESNAPIITMRGVRSANTTEWGDPAVGVHFDGIYSPRPQGALALMFDIERAEVLRGPQGTLFGRNSTVGSVNVISKKPDFDAVSGKLQVEYGRWNQRSVKAVLNVPVTDTFAVRAAAVIEKRDSNLEGFWDPNQWDQRYLQEMGLKFEPTDSAVGPATNDVNNRSFFYDQLYTPIPVADKSKFYNNINNYALRLSAYWQPTEDFSWLLTGEHYRDDSAGGLNPRDCERIKDRPADVNGGSCTDIWGTEDNFVTYVNIPGKNDMTLNSVRSHLVWGVTEGIQLVYNAGYQSQERAGQIDLDQGFYFWDQMLKWVDTDYDSWSHEVQLQSTGEGKLQWIAGYFNFKEDNAMNGQYHGAMGGVSLWLQPKRTIESEAFFAQGTYELTEKLFLTAGARYTKDVKQDQGGRNYGCWSPECYTDVAWAEVWGYIDWSRPLDEQIENTGAVRANLNALPSDYYDYPNAAFAIDSTNDVKEDWSKVTWRIGLDYDLSDDTMIYGYVANGYKGGGIGDVLIRQSDGERFDTSYDGETVITYELGIKTKAMDGKMNLRANAFYSDYKNQQFTQMTTYDVIDIFEVDPDTGLPVAAQQELRTFLTRNAANSKIMGVELEMEWNAWENGHIGGYVTFMDTDISADYTKRWATEPGQVFKDYDEASQDLTKPWFRNLRGNDLAYSPSFSFTMNISHDFNLENGGRITPFLNVHYESSSYVSIDNTDKWELDPSVLNEGIDLDIYSDKRAAWALANFNLKYTAADDVWFLEAYVNNLTNADVNWWQGYAGTTPVAAKARRTYGMRAGVEF
ncbi:TonB-dependent receptor [Paremcibacter congregatus]|uniref:TonB-dependent receptor n=2 Tax=Paremcibacter congregatus TaxID=2043170 RepID=A0A2G4YSC0_9PROT|nr:TonB-dependent receptor [Paremcibacter congregatus]